MENENLYKAPESDVIGDTPVVDYAGFGVRLLASIIDSIWLIALTLVLVWAIYGEAYFDSEETYAGVMDILIQYLLPFAVTVMFWVYKSATPGKMILGLKIVDEQTLIPTTGGKLALRYLGYYVSTLVLFLGFLWVIWDKKKQGWHDKMAGTVVIKVPK